MFLAVLGISTAIHQNYMGGECVCDVVSHPSCLRHTLYFLVLNHSSVGVY